MLRSYLPDILWLIGFVVICVIAFWLIEKMNEPRIKWILQIAGVVIALVILLVKFGVF